MPMMRTLRKRPAASTNYPYATARVRAKKARLLPREEYLKMLKMSIPEITQRISETVYQTQVDDLASRFSGIDLIEGALNVNEEQTYAQVRRITGGEARELVAAFLRRHDYHAIKVILRGKHHGASREEILRELLIEDREEFDFLYKLLADDADGIEGVIQTLRDSGPKGLAYLAALREAESLSRKPSLTEYEDALDRAYHAELLTTIKTGRRQGQEAQARRLFLRYVRLEIDAVNLLAVLRYRKSGIEWTQIQNLLVPGGAQLTMDTLQRIHATTESDELNKELSGTSIIDETMEGALGHDNLSALQIAIQKKLMDSASSFSSSHPLSILPIIDFLLRKSTEVRNLRAIARGKEAGLEESVIEDMLII